MSTIDEIMAACDAVARSPYLSKLHGKNLDTLYSLIAAALADAERKGAEAMRTQLSVLTPEMARAACWRYTVQSAGDYARAVSASPLPTGSQS